MTGNRLKKFLLPILALALIVPLLMPLFAHAQTALPAGSADQVGAADKAAGGGSWMAGIASEVVSMAVKGIVFIINLIAGAIVTLESWAITVVLNISQNLVNSPAVQAGFPIMLSVANLGFVLGIIIIAVGTILRLEQYGIKQMLWKLIMMAILVNFGLVIAGGILNFADSMTMYFVNATSNGSFQDFSASLIASTSNQKNFPGATDPNIIANDPLGATKLAAGITGGGIEKVFAPIVAGLFALVSQFLVILTLGAFIVMLIVRYVWIGILLIMLPLAWLAYVFPGLRGHHSKWWTNFLGQTFFAPIAIFFLWLAMQAATAFNTLKTVTNLATTTDPAWNAVAQTATIAFSPIATNLMQSAMVVGLMLGGLKAASSLGGHGAAAALKTATAAGRWAQGAVITKPSRAAGQWAKNRGKSAVTGTETYGKAASALQRAGAGTGIGSKLLKWTGVGAASRATGRAMERTGTKAGADAVKDHYSRTDGLSHAALQNQFKTARSLEEQTAVIKRYQGIGGEWKNLDQEKLNKLLSAKNETGFVGIKEAKLFSSARYTSGVAEREYTAEKAALEKTLDPNITRLRDERKKLEDLKNKSTDAIGRQKTEEELVKNKNKIEILLKPHEGGATMQRMKELDAKIEESRAKSQESKDMEKLTGLLKKLSDKEEKDEKKGKGSGGASGAGGGSATTSP